MMNKSISLAAVLLIAVLLFSLSSCGNADGTNTSAPTTISDPQTGAETKGATETSVDPTNAPATKAEPTATSDQTVSSEQTTSAEPTATAEPTAPDFENMDYEKYLNLTSEQQYEYFLTFSDPGTFLLWFNEQKDLYEKEHPIVVVEPGDTIDIGN